MNSIELIDKKNALNEKRTAIVEGAKAENRKLSASEQSYFDELGAQVAEIDGQLEEVRRKAQNPKVKTVETNKRGFSLLKAINDVVNNRAFDDNTCEVLDRGRKEIESAGVERAGQITLPRNFRGLSAGEPTEGASLIRTEVSELVTPIYERSLLATAGASYYGGLVGNVSIPTYSGSTVTWEGEKGEAKDGAGSFGDIKLVPHRITAKIPITKQLLIQSSQDVEVALYNDLYNAVAQKLNATAFGRGKGSEYEPQGIFYGKETMSADVTHADLVNLIATTKNEVGAMEKFVMSKTAMAKLMTTKLDEGSGLMLMQGGQVNGYDVINSANVIDNGVAFGNFAELVVGEWGGLDITVDPYTLATKGQILLVVNGFYDIKLRRNDAIKTLILK